MVIFGRIVMVFIGYGLACIAAAIVFTIGTLTPAWDDLSAIGVQSLALWSIVGVAAVFIWGVALLPALLIIALAEGLALRSSVLYAVLGGALALALSFGLDFAGYIGEPDLARERQVLAAAGIAGGLVYWLCAGREAGLLR
jgi:hypothetical protein